MEFRQLAYKYRKYYLRAPKIGKSQLCVNILEHIRSQKGRFLKKDKKTGFLYEQDDKTTVAKIGQLLREGTSKAKICRKYVDFDGARLHPRRTAEEQQTLAPLLEELAIHTQEADQMPGMMRQEGGGGNAVSSLQRSNFSRSAGGHSNY